jgi:hypothetical protein
MIDGDGDSEPARRFCAVPDRNTNGSICRWNQPAWDGKRWVGTPAPRKLLWTCDRSVPTYYRPSLEWAWRQWEKVCAIVAEYTDDERRADLVIQAGRIDGTSGTLAWANLPCGPDRQLASRIDTAERYHLDPTVRPDRGTVHLGAVMCHEFGHVLGLDHDASPARSLLDPMYGADCLTPQAWDIEQAVMRYGPPIGATPTPDPAPKPTKNATARVTIDGVVYAGVLTTES